MKDSTYIVLSQIPILLVHYGETINGLQNKTFLNLNRNSNVG